MSCQKESGEDDAIDRALRNGRAAIEFFRSGTATYSKGVYELMIYSFWSEEDGQTLVEYGLLISLLALAVIGAVTLMGGRVRNMWGTNATRYPDPPT